MPIRFACACGRKLSAKDELAGKRVKCPACGQALQIPRSEVDPAGYRLADDPTPPPPRPAPAVERASDEARPKAIRKKRDDGDARAKYAAVYAKADTPTPSARQYLYLVLALALIPLGFSLTQKVDDKEEGGRLLKTLEKATPEQRERVVRVLERVDKDDASVTKEQLFEALPEHRFADAHLPYSTWRHWLYALAAAGVFFGVILAIRTQSETQAQHVLLVGMFTATFGILFLLAVQFLADMTDGVWIRGNGVVVILFYILKFIGFSYRSAMDPDSNLFLSFLGFTCGVGFCEEVCKALPLLFQFRRNPTLSWRGAMLWGLATGVGFGIAEGIMYSSSYYNGIAPASTYAVRFLSCVALHAIWSASVAITMFNCQELIQQDMAWYEFFLPLARIVAIPMVLHGLYDTLLKKDMNAIALGVAIASFVWLGIQVERMRWSEAAETA